MGGGGIGSSFLGSLILVVLLGGSSYGYSSPLLLGTPIASRTAVISRSWLQSVEDADGMAGGGGSDLLFGCWFCFIGRYLAFL